MRTQYEGDWVVYRQLLSEGTWQANYIVAKSLEDARAYARDCIGDGDAGKWTGLDGDHVLTIDRTEAGEGHQSKTVAEWVKGDWPFGDAHYLCGTSALYEDVFEPANGWRRPEVKA